MGIKLNLRKVQTAWLNVFERAKDRENQDGSVTKGTYNGTFILTPEHPQIEELRDTVFAVVSEALGEAAAEKWMKQNYGEGKHMDKCAVRDIAERDNPFEDFPEGFYFQAKNKQQPLILTSVKGEKQVEPDFNIDGEQIEGEQVYSGCVANISIEIWFSEQYKVLGAKLNGIKFAGEGKAFGGSAVSASVEDLEDDEDEAPRRDRRRNR